MNRLVYERRTGEAWLRMLYVCVSRDGLQRARLFGETKKTTAHKMNERMTDFLACWHPFVFCLSSFYTAPFFWISAFCIL